MKQPPIIGLPSEHPSGIVHRQAIKDLANGLIPMAVATDGIIEAVQMKNKRFVWAVQWHPEYMFKTDKNSMKLFDCFINFAKS